VPLFGNIRERHNRFARAARIERMESMLFPGALKLMLEYPRDSSGAGDCILATTQAHADTAKAFDAYRRGDCNAAAQEL
jgi:hypothetical protein